MDTETVVNELSECAEKSDFERAFKLVRENCKEVGSQLAGNGVRDALKKTTRDRVLLSFLDAVDFAGSPLEKALVKLEKLVSFHEGALVLAKAWGLGKIKRVDYFYRRITVDFKAKRGHQFTYEAAADVLTVPPENHILVLREADPVAFETLRKDQPGEFVKRVLASNGNSMTLVKLEDFIVGNGIEKSVNWKVFWDMARADLKKDKCVVMPVKKTDPIELQPEKSDEDKPKGESWAAAFTALTDPKLILAAVNEFDVGKNFENADEETRNAIASRLKFAVIAASKVDDALYARLACKVNKLKLITPTAAEMRAYLWERKRFIKAAAELPARDIGEMIAFLADSDENKTKLCEAIPEFCYGAVAEVVSQFSGWSVDNEAGEKKYPGREIFGKMLKGAQPPATLVALVVGKIEKFGQFEYAEVKIDGKDIKTLKSFDLWPELPKLPALLANAIALGEGRRAGEVLKMQNLVRRLFGNKEWLGKMFSMLSESEKVLFFERFQASIAWDPSTHHTTVIRMTNIEPKLKARLTKTEKKRELARITSYRGFAMQKAKYLKLVNEDIPANNKKIRFARGFGDLSENAEYQYAKDEQRALMQMQATMQAELEAVKPTDFADATTDEVMPGVTVRLELPDGEKTYTILGEWDGDFDRGIISFKAKLGENLLGKKVGDAFEVPGDSSATRFGRVLEILPLSEEMREWIKLPEGMGI